MMAIACLFECSRCLLDEQAVVVTLSTVPITCHVTMLPILVATCKHILQKPTQWSTAEPSGRRESFERYMTTHTP
jgi:hypothetical protein